MSTKYTIMYGRDEKDIWYHFYFDYKDYGYHLEYKNKKSYNTFLRKIGKILEQCPFSDTGVYQISLKKGVKSKVFKNKECGLLKEENVCLCKKYGYLVGHPNKKVVLIGGKKMLP